MSLAISDAPFWGRAAGRAGSGVVAGAGDGAGAAACGAGAGMAAAYNVPVGGALFALEVLLGSLSLSLVPAAMAGAERELVLDDGVRVG